MLKTVQQKIEYIRKTRYANYLASLRLEGLQPSKIELPNNKDQIIQKYKNQPMTQD